MPLISYILIIVGVVVWIISQYRTTKSNVTALCEHLQAIGISASLIGGTKEWLWGIKGQPHVHHGWLAEWDDILGVIQLKGRDIDSINVVYFHSRRASRWYLDSIVRTSSPYDSIKKDHAKLIMKRSFMGKLVGMEWTGDADLVRELNFDDKLKNKLLNTDPRSLGGSLGLWPEPLIAIVPEPKHGCTIIRMGYFLPTLEQFDILETIAKHIKSA